MKSKSGLTFATIMLSFLAAATAVLAHSGATGIVKQRMDVMGDIGKAMKTIGQMVKGETTFDAELVGRAAGTIGDHATKIPDLFPEKSDTGLSEALPSIWEDWESFLAINEEMKEGAQSLASAARSASSVEEIKAPFGRVGKTCSTCHEKFRLKKQ